ncbi:hypothetical protein OG218_13475 [Kineococcus sp. NBC_00420]|uniref:hypothetical protein n=1 Tax=unclassified Kineococcus TaxID=2621656 RepID=UPI002E24E7FF
MISEVAPAGLETVFSTNGGADGIEHAERIGHEVLGAGLRALQDEHPSSGKSAASEFPGLDLGTDRASEEPIAP